MEKEENQNKEENILKKEDGSDGDTPSEKKKEDQKKDEISPEKKVLELEDKVTRVLAEMENQRRRIEKEKDQTN